MVFGTLLGIIIILFILGICFSMMYWAYYHIRKSGLNSKVNSNTSVLEELDALKKRVELLEGKLKKY